ncbi:hypothetical protein MMC11_003107 [Xylographa trunciseda]|nr:hypothetical protein [Xylographa trunciseda]
MSCPTAQRWFVSNDEFNIANEDYVFCNARAEVIKDEAAYFDDICWDCPDVPKNFFSEAKLMATNFFPSFEFGGRLMYADAHLQDPKDWQDVLGTRSKTPQLKELPEDITKAQEMLCETLRPLFMPAQSDGGPSREEFAAIVECRYRHGAIDSTAVSYLVAKKGTSEQETALTYLSGQGRMHEKRPVLLFLGAIINTRTSTDERKAGIAYAYDFQKDAVIIKSFTYSKGQHPFPKSWFEKESEDDYYLQQPISELAESILDPNEDQAHPPRACFVDLAKYLVGDWIRYFSHDFKLSDDVAISFGDKMKALMKHLWRIKAPEVKSQEDTERDIVFQFNELRRELILDEPTLREIALEAQEDGQTIAAENMAKFFERSTRDLKQLADHPEVPLDI